MIKKILIISVIIIFILLVGFYLIIFTESSIKEPENLVEKMTENTNEGIFLFERITRYPIRVYIPAFSNNITIGIAGQQEELDFGILPRHTIGRKLILVQNEDKIPAKVHLRVYGNITELVNFEKNDFVLEVNESITISVDAHMTGNYSGEVQIIMRKPKNEFLGWLVAWI